MATPRPRLPFRNNSQDASYTILLEWWAALEADKGERAELNRDDLNRPKTAVMGGVQRLRVSSQSLKRAWRTSDTFKEALSGYIGTRTKEMGLRVYERLQGAGVAEK